MNTADRRVPRTPETDDPSPPTWMTAILKKVEAHMDTVIDDPARLEETLNTLTPGQRALYAVMWYEMEVNNGGHHQYFINSAGGFASEAMDGLRMFQATDFASALKTALSIFPAGQAPRDRDQRGDLVDNGDPDTLEEADSNFFDAYTGEESLAKLARVYVDAHPQEFFS